MKKSCVHQPAKASQIQILLDVILSFLNVLDAIARIFGIDFSGGEA